MDGRRKGGPMGILKELTLQTSYHKGRDDIAEDFYLPCMRRASEYDRAVGYFRSTAFIIAWPALRDFVRRGGRIRVLCSDSRPGSSRRYAAFSATK
jgi:hypothetical protein